MFLQQIRPRFGLPLIALVFAAVHLAFEHLNGGVQSHHLLQRADMPALSNWWGLLILPLLGLLAARRIRAGAEHAGERRGILLAGVGALLYGAAMALSFELGVNNVTAAALLGLFLCGLVLPVHRAEYVLGFVAGMTFTFGSVIPLLIAAVVGMISLVVRRGIGAIAGKLRNQGRKPG